NDTITTGASVDTILGGLGDDVIHTGNGSDTVDGGAGIDTVNPPDSTYGIVVDFTLAPDVSDYYALTYSGAAGTERFKNIEIFVGTDGAANIMTMDSSYGTGVTLVGGTGDDTVFGAEGYDNGFLGGDGNDTLDYSGLTLGKIEFDWGVDYTIDKTGDATTDTVDGTIEVVIGTSFKDTMSGDANNNHFIGGADEDLLTGNDGDDTLDGGDGNDALHGGMGMDVITGGLGNDLAYGNDDDDTFIGGDGLDSYEGGAGIDLIDYSTYGHAISLDLENSFIYKDANDDALFETTAEGDELDTIVSIESFRGTAFNDTLVGSNSDDETIYGGDGDDYINGRGTNVPSGGVGDIIYGEAGNDYVRTGGNNNTGAEYHGGDNDLDGGDLIDMYSIGANITIDLSVSDVAISGNGTIQVTGFEHIRSGSGE
ncbi:MAG: calcium-binding protein, partial [Pseudomonadota bacterium]|nr:calcium-binding protein [Pseudomonadota bacterium]